MNLEKWEKDGHPSFKSKLAFVLVLLLYLKIYFSAEKVSQFVKAKISGHPNNLREKEIFLRYLRQNISRITGVYDGSEISVRNIQRLKGIVNVTYLVELLLKRPDGSSNIEKIVGRHITFSGTYERTTSFLKLYGKRILQIRPISYPRERIKAELDCVHKMKGARVRMPDIVHVDLQRGYIFTRFVEGETVHDIVHQICKQKFIENWQVKLFEEIGQGLAEINLKLKIAHGDTFTGNWIYEKKSGNLFLTDWETAGRGDPAWDLAHLIYTVGADLGMLRETTTLFNTIFLAIIKGYAKIDVNKEVVKRFTSYWMNHALKVPPRIHEIIFKHQGGSLPGAPRVLRSLRAPYFNRHSPVEQKSSSADRMVFRLLKTYLTLHSVVLLISGRTNSELL